ncbi:hypothetical protein [Xanthomonas arboricola]|uniref:hypothetical protein n=1 Tax=Xanthomonas arboricola TaxID=56448 RepID=UPI0011AFF3C3|nr:hypothetical protein [Xanthomonas arboricola]
MKKRKFVLAANVMAAVLMLTGCEWSATIRKKVGQPAEGEITIRGGGRSSVLKNMGLVSAAISATDIYIETAGTDFNLNSVGNVAITLSDDAGNLLASSTFPWVKSGTKLVFKNPETVQSWLNSYPSAVGVNTKINYGNTPIDGADHVISSAVMYQGERRASSSITVPAECWSRFRTRVACASM